MFVPMILGYTLGAVGVYAALYRFAPLAGASSAEGTTHAPQDNVIVLFELPADERRAA